ncbi:sulfatase family protein [Nitrosopumilus sp.]|uniref:sulfatase family protein n=1 Tax=Nitrosopumilus sp. TaxID=2024843 RepID=UPI003D0BC1E2
MRQNILLIVVDSLRYDKFFGPLKTAKTPNIDKLIDNGFIFTNTISSTDSTYSSLGSLFSGKHPYNHQISWFNNHSKVINYFEFLKNNNYNLNGTFQNQSFFQTLSSIFDDVDLVDGQPYLRLFEGLGGKILQRLEKIKNAEPWFYYIHLMDFHISKQLPDEYNNEDFGQTTWDKRLHILDSWIGKFLEKIELKNTVIIITSDHGEFDIDLDVDYGSIPKLQKFLKSIKSKSPKVIEPLGVDFFVFLRETKRKYVERKLKEHSADEELQQLSRRGKTILFDDVIRIPLLISGGNVQHGMSNQQVRQIDIFPTIYDLLSIKNEKGFDGISLKPFFKKKDISDLIGYIESAPDPNANDELGEFVGIRTANFKFVRSRDNSKNRKTFLFDLKNDPSEKINIASTKPDIVQEMESLLSKHRKHENNLTPESDDEEISKIKDELKKMGYI